MYVLLLLLLLLSLKLDYLLDYSILSVIPGPGPGTLRTSKVRGHPDPRFIDKKNHATSLHCCLSLEGL